MDEVPVWDEQFSLTLALSLCLAPLPPTTPYVRVTHRPILLSESLTYQYKQWLSEKDNVQQCFLFLTLSPYVPVYSHLSLTSPPPSSSPHSTVPRPLSITTLC